MIFLGIDPGSHRIGYGLVRSGKQRMEPVAYGVIENIGDDRAGHIRHVEQELRALVTRFNPVAAGLERLFFAANRKTAMAVSEMRGILFAALTRAKIPVHEFTPLQVKRAVCGYGKADKAQIQRVVRMVLNIRDPIRPDDAADALAIAICCSAAPISPLGS